MYNGSNSIQHHQTACKETQRSGILIGWTETAETFAEIAIVLLQEYVCFNIYMTTSFLFRSFPLFLQSFYQVPQELWTRECHSGLVQADLPEVPHKLSHERIITVVL